MATAIPTACLASSAIRCRDVETGPNLGVLAVFPSTGATCRCPLPSTGSRGLNSPASAVADREAANTIVSIDLTSGVETVLVSGNDFYSTPRLRANAHGTENRSDTPALTH